MGHKGCMGFHKFQIELCVGPKRTKGLGDSVRSKSIFPTPLLSLWLERGSLGFVFSGVIAAVLAEEGDQGRWLATWFARPDLRLDREKSFYC